MSCCCCWMLHQVLPNNPKMDSAWRPQNFHQTKWQHWQEVCPSVVQDKLRQRWQQSAGCLMCLLWRSCCCRPETLAHSSFLKPGIRQQSVAATATAAADVAGSRGKFLSHVTSPGWAGAGTDDDGDDVPGSAPLSLRRLLEASGIFTTDIFRILLKSSLRHPENSDAEWIIRRFKFPVIHAVKESICGQIVWKIDWRINGRRHCVATPICCNKVYIVCAIHIYDMILDQHQHLNCLLNCENLS